MRVVCALWVVALCAAMLQSASAAGSAGRFADYEFDEADTLDGADVQADDDGDWAYDLSTVRLLSPGKFTIIYNVSYHPAFVRAKLKIFNALRPYCARPEGMYPIPGNLLSELAQ